MWYKLLCLLLCCSCSIRPLHKEVEGDRRDSIYVDVIAERDGQLLRRYLRDIIRDWCLVGEGYHLNVRLSTFEQGFSPTVNDNMQRRKVTYRAYVVLTDHDKKVLLSKQCEVASSYNIASAQGSAIYAMYGRSNRDAIYELSLRIGEMVRMVLQHES